MPNSSLAPQVVHFGVFEADLRSGELSKHGAKLRIQEQPFQVLAMLLAQPGQVVTREELRKKLWPDHTFVDFEHGLNAAINKLRGALGDPADNPRFIETLHRRGYRFIAPVGAHQPLASAQPAPEAEERAVAAVYDRRPDVAAVPQVRDRLDAAPLPERQKDAALIERRYSWRWLVITLAGALVLVGSVLVYWLTRPLPPPRVTRTLQLTNNGRRKLDPLLSDGPRLYFVEATGPLLRRGLVELSTAGGETFSVSTPFQGQRDALMDVSPDGSELLLGSRVAYETEGPLWILPALGGSPRRAGDAMVNLLWLSERGGAGGIIPAFGAGWSPEGQKIVYARGKDLSVMKANGSDSHELVALNGTPAFPRWSPDGKRIRFTLLDLETTKAYSLWEVDADGSHLHPLLPGWNAPPAECCGNWTPDGKYYLFRARRGAAADIWAMREASGSFHNGPMAPVQLTTGTMWLGSPLPGRDGKRIFVLGTQLRGELMGFDARNRELAPYLSGVSASEVAFSRDGDWVCYSTYPEGILWRSKLDGSQRLQLTVAPMVAVVPRWSPDSKRIAFTTWTAGEPHKTYVVSREGGAPQQLMPGARNEADAQWSPDGNSILFGRFPNYVIPEPPEDKALYLLDLKTNQVSKIPGSEGLYSPRWSPDGRHVATLDFDSKKLILFDFVTHQREELVSSKGGVGFPSWTHDGKDIYFLGTLTPDNAGIFRVRVSDHKIERVVRDNELGRFWGVSGGWFGLAPDDSLLVMRDHSATEAYAMEWEAP